jgi:O-methyltransferase involved in polyketide biosynthesis
MNWDEANATAAKMRELDVTTPNVARIYDFLLGGKDHYHADRVAAAQLACALPHCPEAARENRAFLGRVVRHLAGNGIRQFLDIGSGLPTAANTHQAAQQVSHAARVVYVDYDLTVCAHARALLQDGPAAEVGVDVVQADVRDLDEVIAGASALLDFTEPVAVLLLAVLHFLPGSDDPHAIVRDLTGNLAPGSAVAISHITGDETAPDASLAAQQVYQGASAPAVPRGLGDVERFFTGLSLIPPGVVDIRAWHRRNPDLTAPLAFYGGVGLVPRGER